MTYPDEQRSGYIDLAEVVREVAQTVHSHDTEIAVLRAQVQADSGRITLLENAVEKIYSRLDEVKDMLVTSRDLLESHTRQEVADRLKLMHGHALIYWIIATLVSVLVSAGVYVLHMLLTR